MNQACNSRDLLPLCTLPATPQALKEFCTALFHIKVADLDLNKCSISLKFQCNPFQPNGYVRATRIRKRWRFYVSINMWHVSKSEAYSDAERYFYTCATLCHELRHVFLQVKGEDNCFDDYRHYIAFMESTERFSRSYLAEAYAMIFSIKKYSQYRKYKYMTNPAELICMQYGYSESLALLHSILSEKEKSVIDRVINSISLTCESLEVGYIHSLQPVNLFAKLLGNVITACRKNTNLIALYPQFRLFWTETGEFFDLEHIYRTGKVEHLNYLADVVVRIFSFSDESSLKKNGLSEEMYNDLECWANKYIAMGIRYLQNKELAKVILSDQIVEDNAAVIIKTISLINRRMALLGMQHDMGNVFPTYKI